MPITVREINYHKVAERWPDLTASDLQWLGLGCWHGDGSRPDGELGGSPRMVEGWREMISRAKRDVAEWNAQQRTYTAEELAEIINHIKGE